MPLVVALAAYLCFHLIGRSSLSNDEGTSFFIAQLDWTHFWRSLVSSEANSSLFYLILRFWRRLGESESMLRTLPAIFAVASVPVLYAYLKRALPALAALAGALLLATNAFFVAFAQELRGYSLSALLVTVSTLLFDRAITAPTRGRWTAYVVVTTLAAYAHMFAAFVIAAHVISLAFLGRRKTPWKHALVSYGAIAVATLPLALFALVRDVGQVDQIAPPSLRRLDTVLHDLTGFATDPLLWIYGALLLTVVGWLVVAVVRDGRSLWSWRLAVVALWLVLPVAASFAFSYVKPLFLSRYLTVAVPAVAAVAATALSALRSRSLIAAGAAVMVLLGWNGLSTFYDDLTVTGWRTRADRVLRNAQPGDVAVFYSPTVIRPYGYYGGYFTEGLVPEGRFPEPIYPDKLWLGFSATTFDPDYEAIAARAARSERVWFLTGHTRTRLRRLEREALETTLTELCGDTAPGLSSGAVVLYLGCNRTAAR
jgi:4-amino-4-deoxy-L-arabinose transferase-like glycosyltransferase